MARGGGRVAWAARAALGAVISSGETGWLPRVIEQTGVGGDWMPSRRAVSTTAWGPICVTSWAKMVLTELAVAWVRFIVPAVSSALLWTSQSWPPVRQRGSLI